MLIQQKAYDDVKKKCLERLKYEEREKNDKKLTEKTCIWYGKPLEYSLALYSYYECFKCKTSYFGGLKACENGIDEGPNKEFKPEELVCANCCSVEPIENC